MDIKVIPLPQPTFYIRDIPIYGDLILSPMAGISDKPYRSICRDYGSAMSYTEFVAIDAIIHANKNTQRMLDYAEHERPMVFQIFGNDVDKFEEAARIIEQLGPNIIDINMGCSVPKVSGRGAGAGLLRDPQKIGQIFKRLTKAVSIPITGKIRLGWDEHSLNYLDVVKVMEDNGASLVAVHGRTKAQAYQGQANWDAIADIKRVATIPVIGNGDVKTVADIEHMKRHTNCDAVMIARAAIGNPWIFQRKDIEEISLAEKATLIKRHLAAMLDFYGEERGLVLFRKHVVKYVRGWQGIKEVKQQLVTCTQAEQFIALLQAYETDIAIRYPSHYEPAYSCGVSVLA